MNAVIKRLIIGLTIALSISSPVLAISANDKQAVLNDTVFYDENDQCLTGGPAGSGPLFGLHFPRVSDTADLSKRINDFIKSQEPGSPLNGFGDTFVSLGQKYDVNPAYIVGDANSETSLGTTGQETTRNYFGITGEAGFPTNSNGFSIYSTVAVGLEEYYKQISGPGYLGPPTNMTQVIQVTSKTTPNANAPSKAANIIDVMNKILAGMTIDTSQSASAVINVAPIDSCSSGSTTAGALGWDLRGPHAMVSYDQIDPRWASKPYGSGKTSIGQSGCGPTSMAMVAATLTGDQSITPVTIADKYGAQYHVVEGTSHAVFPVFAKDYGLKYTPISDLNAAANILRQGGLVIAGFGPDYFTHGGHIMVIRAVSPDGSSFYIADPNGDGLHHDSETRAFSTSFLESAGGLTSMYGFMK